MTAETHIEPILRHDELPEGWHHHHTEAGVVVHLTEASGHFIDDDGSTVIYSAHHADHDEALDAETPCLDDACDFAGRHPERLPMLGDRRTFVLPSTTFRGRSPRWRWLPERNMCCDPKADIICPYNETWREYVTRIIVCAGVGHRWDRFGIWRMCDRCRWIEVDEEVPA